ncbi:MAG: tyrosine-type recombinase/integrase [Xanthomonadales bacterium]|nr:tyrosine-type recombinase/integrase [Xanthomonadales bacterium]
MNAVIQLPQTFDEHDAAGVPRRGTDHAATHAQAQKDRLHHGGAQALLHRANHPRLSSGGHPVPRIKITDEYALVKRKGSENWYLEWRDRGEKIRRSTGARSVEQARVKAREIILEDATIRDEQPADMPLLAVLDRYMIQHGNQLAAKSANKRAVKLWREFWGDAAVVADLTVKRQKEFSAWLYGRGYSQGYVRRTLATGKAALNRAWENQEIVQAPFVPLPALSEAYPHFATSLQLAALLNAIPPDSHLWTYCMIRLNTGCRGDAALDLQPFQIDRAASLIRLNPPGRKQTKKHRPVVPLTSTLRKVLDGVTGASYFVNWHGRRIISIRKTWNKLRDDARLPQWFSPKILRHTLATELRKRGVPGWEVSGQLGHCSGESHRTTEIYAKFDPQYRQGPQGDRRLDA